jgi:hypothetical protein
MTNIENSNITIVILNGVQDILIRYIFNKIELSSF